MDVFKLDQSLAAGLGGAPSADKLTADVSFGAGTTEEFNLSFFDDTTTDTAGSESHDPPTQGFSDEPCTTVPMDTSTPAAAFRDVRVQSPCTSSTYRQPTAYAGRVAASQPPPPPPTAAVTNSTPSSSTTAPGQCSNRERFAIFPVDSYTTRHDCYVFIRPKTVTIPR